MLLCSHADVYFYLGDFSYAGADPQVRVQLPCRTVCCAVSSAKWSGMARCAGHMSGTGRVPGCLLGGRSQFTHRLRAARHVRVQRLYACARPDTKLFDECAPARGQTCACPMAQRRRRRTSASARPSSRTPTRSPGCCSRCGRARRSWRPPGCGTAACSSQADMRCPWGDTEPVLTSCVGLAAAESSQQNAVHALAGGQSMSQSMCPRYVLCCGAQA